MKRLTTPSFRYHLHRAFVVTLLGIAALALFGKAAHAQPCSDPEAVPEAVFFALDEVLGDVFPLPQKECEKIVKTGVSACRAAVADAVHCAQSLFKSALKARKTACKTLEGGEAAACFESVETLIDAAEQSLEMSAAAADMECDGVFANELADECLGGALPE